MKNQFFNQSHFLPSSDFLRLYKTFSLQNSISFVLWKVNPAKIFKGKAQAEIRWLKVGYLLNVKGYWMLVTKMAKTVTTSWSRINKFRHQHRCKLHTRVYRVTTKYNWYVLYDSYNMKLTRIPTVKLKIPEKAFLKFESRTSVTFKLYYLLSPNRCHW